MTELGQLGIPNSCFQVGTLTVLPEVKDCEVQVVTKRTVEPAVKVRATWVAVPDADTETPFLAAMVTFLEPAPASPTALV